MAEKGIVTYKTEAGTDIKLSDNIIRRYLCEGATDQECMLFMGMCRTHKLDPFTREAYLIKYGDRPAQMVVGKDVFTKRAFRNPRFEGMQAGIFVIDRNGKGKEREGSMVLDGERIVGAWAKVYVQGYKEPIYESVSFSEYSTGKGNWKPSSQGGKPATMIRKVALVHALREAFPEDLGGLYDAAEMGGVSEEELDVQTVPVEVTDPAESAHEEEIPMEVYEAEGAYYEEDEAF